MEVDVAVRWQDLDALGHVNHAVYLTYFEEQRDRWLRDRVGLDGSDYVVASAQIDYKAPILQDDGPVRVSGSVERLGRTSLTLDSVLRSAHGHVCATCRTSIVLWDTTGGGSRPLSAQEREVLEAEAQAGAANAVRSPTSGAGR